ncbi:hypothetical protein HDU76_006269 [Blyttiomyces sp. JEL0837]|nr:hypothetical protein HDU76_006269 [Blyttiomyces sp. JEL0837]
MDILAAAQMASANEDVNKAKRKLEEASKEHEEASWELREWKQKNPKVFSGEEYSNLHAAVRDREAALEKREAFYLALLTRSGAGPMEIDSFPAQDTGTNSGSISVRESVAQRRPPVSDAMDTHQATTSDKAAIAKDWSVPECHVNEVNAELSSLNLLANADEYFTLPEVSLGKTKVPFPMDGSSLLFWKLGTLSKQDSVQKCLERCLEQRLSVMLGTSGCGKTRTIYEVLSRVFGLYLTVSNNKNDFTLGLAR